MRKKITAIIFIIILSLVVIGILLFINSIHKNKVEFLGKRTFIEKKIIKSIPLHQKYSFLKIYDDDIYMISWEEGYTGKLFRHNSHKISTVYNLGDVKKELSIADYFIIKEKGKPSYYFLSGDGTTLIGANEKGIFLDFQFSMPAQRIYLKDKENVMIYTWNTHHYIPEFYTYNLATHIHQKLKIDPKIIQNIKYPAVTLDGIISNNSKQIIFTSFGQNQVLLFDKDFKYTGNFHLNIKNPEFKYIENKDHTPIIDPNNIYPNIWTDSDEDYLYVLTNDEGKLKSTSIYYIDKYSLSTHKYINSMRLVLGRNDYAKEIKVSNNKIYVLSNNNITVYE